MSQGRTHSLKTTLQSNENYWVGGSGSYPQNILKPNINTKLTF